MSDEPGQFRELRMLQELEASPESSQRELAQNLGIALGLTNTVLRNLGKKGFIRASQAGWKRWLYAITPEGFTHKSRLTIRYVARVLDDYGEVRTSLRKELSSLAFHSEIRVALYGTHELAELVYLGLKDLGVNDIDVFYNVEQNESRFIGMPVSYIKNLAPENYDKVILADLDSATEISGLLISQGVPEAGIITMFSNQSERGTQLTLISDKDSNNG